VKFFPITAESKQILTQIGPFDLQVGILRLVTDSLVAFSFIKSGSTACTTLLNAGKAYYFRVANFSLCDSWSAKTLSGFPILNISYSPDFGGDFDNSPSRGGSFTASNPVIGLPSALPLGDVLFTRKLNSVDTYIQFNGTADTNSVLVIGDEYFRLPGGQTYTAYAASATETAIRGTK